ncbi:MAG: hypothetical protein CVU05_00605 [Bacteroidetes bacterium HGW-Bacteroidetes-21]|jgi:hypothetical protein|nr:MAG: hypothetical protein CVU05_00605 [Bacteroidetes bacterium HGW-Bacteroidetes-21]
MKASLFIGLLLITLISCKKENSDYVVPDAGYDYFPLVTGTVNYYFVESITIDKPSTYFDTVRYYLKIVIDTSFVDDEGNTVFPVKRYTSSSLSGNWVIADVWYAFSNAAMSVMTEENMKYVKIRYSVEKAKKWDGNVYNISDEQTYSISSVDVPYSLNSLSYDSVLTVVHEEYETLINKYFTYEKYAKFKGLIEYYSLNIVYAETNYTVPIEERILRGTIFRMERVAN